MLSLQGKDSGSTACQTHEQAAARLPRLASQAHRWHCHWQPCVMLLKDAGSSYVVAAYSNKAIVADDSPRKLRAAVDTA